MSRPNLLFVIADQWRASAIGAQGGDPVITPNLDALAAESRSLTNAVSNYPVCSPCRAMWMSGQYPFANGVPLNVNSVTAPLGVGLRPDATCWSDVLHDAGYDLGYIGKWHLDPPTDADARYGEGPREDGCVWDAYTPRGRRHGFDFWYSHGCCDDHLRPHYWTTDAPREQPVQVDEWSPIHETDVAETFLRSAAQRYHADGTPFGLVVSYNPPHQPFDTVPARYLQPYRDLDERQLLVRPNVEHDSEAGAEAARIAPRYFAAMTGVDEQIGRLLAALAEQHLDRDTVVVFTSDHGMQLGSHGLIYKNVWFDESLLVPFLVRAPGHVRPGRDDLLLSSPDVAPTLLGLLGLADRIPAAMHGRDLSGPLRGEDGPRPGTALYLRPSGGVEGAAADMRGLRTHSRMLVVERHPDARTVVRLYDLDDDPYQRSDIAAERPREVATLLGQLDAELRRTGDPWADEPLAGAPQ